MTVDEVITLLKEQGNNLRDPIGDNNMPPMVFSCTFSPNGANAEEIESVPGSCPTPLGDFWRNAQSARLFEDRTYGQWGLEVLSPTQSVEATRFELDQHPDDFVEGDLVLGRFLGDSDLLIIRCDASSPDFGRLLVALPLDPRQDWYCVADTFEDFLSKYVAVKGEKYWERRV